MNQFICIVLAFFLCRKLSPGNPLASSANNAIHYHEFFVFSSFIPSGIPSKITRESINFCCSKLLFCAIKRWVYRPGLSALLTHFNLIKLHQLMDTTGATHHFRRLMLVLKGILLSGGIEFQLLSLANIYANCSIKRTSKNDLNPNNSFGFYSESRER